MCLPDAGQRNVVISEIKLNLHISQLILLMIRFYAHVIFVVAVHPVYPVFLQLRLRDYRA